MLVAPGQAFCTVPKYLFSAMSFLRVFCRIGCPSDTKTEPKRCLLEGIFREQCQNGKRCLDCAGVDGMHMNPSRGALRGIQNSKKSELRTKRAWKAQGCTENTRKTTPIEVKMGTKAATLFPHFSMGGPMRGHRGAEISKTCCWYTESLKCDLPNTKNETRSIQNGI